MTTSAPTETPVYEPTFTQQERAMARRRFNRLYIYLPLGLASMAIVALVVLMLWGALSPNIVGTREFASGLADIVIILTIMPLLLLCAIVPAGAIGYVVYRRQQPQREHGRFQILIWRLDGLVNKAHDKVEVALPKAANPVIDGHARMTYWRTLIKKLKNK
jgi:hypothetical protein